VPAESVFGLSSAAASCEADPIMSPVVAALKSRREIGSGMVDSRKQKVAERNGIKGSREANLPVSRLGRSLVAAVLPSTGRG
jgi:hypothetical protein